MKPQVTFATFLLLLLASFALRAEERPDSLRLATFRCDVTPPMGAPLCGGLVKPVAGVTEPLLALGVVILGPDKPVVLCEVDWCEIHGNDQVRWRKQLARAAGTTPERVAVQTLHQHNAPIADTVAQEILAKTANPVRVVDVEWANRALAGVAAGVASSLTRAEPLTHIAHGEAKVIQVASNRRILGPDGKVIGVRTSATKDAKLREQPEGTIDPMLFAQQKCPNAFVATASYGDCGPAYIPLEKSFAEGGYEPTWAFAAPQSEQTMKDTILELIESR